MTPETIDRLSEPFLKLGRDTGPAVSHGAKRIGERATETVEGLWKNRYVENLGTYLFQMNLVGKTLTLIAKSGRTVWDKEALTFYTSTLERAFRVLERSHPGAKDLYTLEVLEKQARSYLKAIS